jgi:PAS domain-containing protein
LRAIPISRATKGPDATGLDKLAKLAMESREVIIDDRDTTIVQAQAQALNYQTTFDAFTLGVCRFDGEGRLVLNNRRYGEIYRLASREIRPGATQPEITELRVVAGTSAVASKADTALPPSTNATAASKTWTEKLKDVCAALTKLATGAARFATAAE